MGVEDPEWDTEKLWDSPSLPANAVQVIGRPQGGGEAAKISVTSLRHPYLLFLSNDSSRRRTGQRLQVFMR